MIRAIIDWFFHITGASNVSGTYYGFWSGFGSDITEFAVLGALVANLKHLNCEVKGCWNITRHSTAAGHRVCSKHNPGGAPTHADVIRAHTKAVIKKEATT